MKYQYSIWKGDFEGALQECKNVVTSLAGGEQLKGYRAFWHYLAGSAAWMASKQGNNSLESIARENFKRAAVTTEGVTWLFGLSKLTSEKVQEDEQYKARLAAVIEGLGNKLLELKLTNSRKFEKEVKYIIENLKRISGDNKDSKAFESAHERLGSLLGYSSGNSEEDRVPDPWWMAGEDLCIVFEDYSGKEENPLGSNKVEQAISHPEWMRSKKLVNANSEIVSVILTPCRTLTSGAQAIIGNHEIGYWNYSEFLTWAETAIAVVRSLRNKFPGEADLHWRELAIQAYKDAHLDPESLICFFKENKLSGLPVQN